MSKIYFLTFVVHDYFLQPRNIYKKSIFETARTVTHMWLGAKQKKCVNYKS